MIDGTTAGLAALGSGLVVDDVGTLAIFLRPVMRAIAAAGGPSCEVVLHDLSAPTVDLSTTIVGIENGHVTGRAVGGPSTNLGLGVVHDQNADHDAFGYRGFTSDGRELLCSSVYFRDRGGRVIAALCINTDISVVRQAQTLLDSLAPRADAPPTTPSEFIGPDLTSVLDAMIVDAVREGGTPVERMTRQERIAILVRLDAQGALRMRKAVDKIAARLGISRVTVYKYLDEARAQGDIAPR